MQSLDFAQKSMHFLEKIKILRKKLDNLVNVPLTYQLSR